ncbi:Protein of unknown function [Lactobacillus acidophilus DSM 9126]|jgi:transcriptional regulator with GAF, ATPase, and Fis domain
MTVAL